MTSGAGLDVESATFLRQLDMLVDEFRKPLTPIGGDVEIVKEGEFFFGLWPHELLTTEGIKEKEQERLEFRLQAAFS